MSINIKNLHLTYVTTTKSNQVLRSEKVRNCKEGGGLNERTRETRVVLERHSLSLFEVIVEEWEVVREYV